MPETKKGTIAFSRAAITPNSYNKEERSFEVTFASETPVYRNPWYSDEPFNEVLACRADCVRLERAAAGLPVFDNHFNGGVLTQLGLCTEIRFEGQTLVGKIVLGARADDALVSDIENGILSGVSVGYNVYAYTRDKPSKQDVPTYTATDWEPLEVSLAPVQADINSKIRSQEEHTLLIINKTSSKMTVQEIRAKATDEEKKRLDEILDVTRAAKLDEAKAVELYASDKTIDEIRQAHPAVTTPEPDPASEPVNVEQIRKDATNEEKSRLNAILLSTRAAKLDDTKAVEYYLSGKSIDEIRQAIIEEFRKGDPKMVNVTIGTESIDKKRAAVEIAMLHRAAPTIFKDEKNESSEFRGMTLMEIGKELLQERGVNVRGRSKAEISAMILGGARDMSTSDFPLLLENVANKMLRADYNLAPEYWDQIARQTSVSDFRAKSLYQVGSSNGMKELPEGDEIKYGKLTEAKQTIKVKSYGEGLLFTRQMLINDDLSAFERIPQKFVRDWNQQRGDLVWALITDNVKMDDGKALFHADHKNLAATAGIIGDTTLEAALIAIKNQTDIDGKTRIRIVPRFICVSPEYEITARKLLTVIAPTNTGDVNVFASMGLTLIVEPRLIGKAWYLAADPSAVESLYYANLDGNGGLRSNREDNFDTDSLKLAVRGEFGVAAIDYRGWFKNNGQ